MAEEARPDYNRRLSVGATVYFVERSDESGRSDALGPLGGGVDELNDRANPLVVKKGKVTWVGDLGYPQVAIRDDRLNVSNNGVDVAKSPRDLLTPDEFLAALSEAGKLSAGTTVPGMPPVAKETFLDRLVVKDEDKADLVAICGKVLLGRLVDEDLLGPQEY